MFFDINWKHSQTDFQQNKDWNVLRLRNTLEIKASPRPISNKTRIETNLDILFDYTIRAPRPISNKTRIETC